ncbi:hypothetical protein [Bacillus smithii]|uniref:hypothetical protein n=1 Tax=Bacillus smithii TaxID=1479 RepID=UPI003D2622D8
MKCPYCDRKPHEITEYVDAAKHEDMTPEEYVRSEEGTFDVRTQLFCCTKCYIKIGMPLINELREAFDYYRSNVEPLEG